MDLLNEKITHKLFGTGIVTEANTDKIKIQFEGFSKNFVYPDAFEKFLIAEDNTIQQAIETEIASTRQKDEQIRKEKEEAERKRKEKLLQDELVQNTKKWINDGFGPDYNAKFLSTRQSLSYQDVEKQYGIKISGFGKGINITPSAVVLISSIDKKATGFVYHDHWSVDGDYIYSGEGKIGDQIMTSGNKAIVDAEQNGKKIYLFVKLSSSEYFYQGQFFLVDYTYEDAKDENNNIRKEYKFKLRRIPSKKE